MYFRRKKTFWDNL